MVVLELIKRETLEVWRFSWRLVFDSWSSVLILLRYLDSAWRGKAVGRRIPKPSLQALCNAPCVYRTVMASGGFSNRLT